jgi:anti-sigma factor RsiW
MSAYIDGDLSQRSRHRLQRHVRECPECQRVLLGLQRMLRRLRAIPGPAGDEAPDIASAVRRRLRERRNE